MANYTTEENQELIEVLKFTPRTYKVRLWGYGGEYVMGTVDREIFDYFRERRLSVEEFAWDSDYADEKEIPEDKWPFTPGCWSDCDGMGHSWGVDRHCGTIQVDDEEGNTVFERQLENINGYDNDSPEWGGGDEIWIDEKPPGTIVFVGVSSEKGTFFEADIELKTPFNPSKLVLSYDEIDGNEIITSVTYDGEDLENYGGDTTGKSSDFAFYIAGSSEKTGKFERYKDMDDIEYELSEWFLAKTKPERQGMYDIITKDDRHYHAHWNGEYWHNDWNNEKIKVKQWRGVAYDPDTHFSRDEY